MTQSAPSLPHDPNNPPPHGHVPVVGYLLLKVYSGLGNFLLFNLIPSTTFKKENLYFLISTVVNIISTDNLIIKETFDNS